MFSEIVAALFTGQATRIWPALATEVKEAMVPGIWCERIRTADLLLRRHWGQPI